MLAPEVQISNLDVLPEEKICEIIEKLEPRDLVSLIQTSRRARDLAQLCVTSLSTRDGEFLPAPFVLSFRNLTRVAGNVRVSSVEELEAVSRRIRGSLTVSMEISAQLIGLRFDAPFLKQDAFLRLLSIRTALFPESLCRGELVIKGYVPVFEGGPHLIAYDPSLQELSLNLNIPDRFLGYPREREYTSLITGLMKLPIRSLNISVIGKERVLFVPVSLSRQTMRDLDALDLTELTIRSNELHWLVNYLSDRLGGRLPMHLQRLNFLPSFDRGRELSISDLDLFLKVRSSPIPSVIEINGLQPTVKLGVLMNIFPNLRKVGVVLLQGTNLSDISGAWNATERGVTLEVIRYGK